MTFDECLRALDDGPAAPVYFLYGEERFFHTEILAALVQRLITPENRDFNYETFDAKSSQPGDWIGSARTFSFLGGTRLVVVRNLHEASLNDGGTRLLLDYAADPVGESCLAITCDRVDRKRKLFKKLTALPGAVECAAPRKWALVDWIKNRARGRNYTLTGGAAKMMVDRVGAKPGLLAGELEKVLTYAGTSTRITEREVAEMVGEIKLENVFALTEALKGKNVTAALRILHNQLDHNEDPIKVLGTISWQFRMIWEVKFHRGRNLSAAQIAERMGTKPFVVDKAMKFTGNFTPRQLRGGFTALGEADRELKSSGKSPQVVLQSLVLKLCSGGS